MKLIFKNTLELTPYERNPRKNNKAIPYVAKSIKEFGFKVPIVIDNQGVIVAGHTRYEAAKQLGLKDVPCIVADDLTEEQIKAFRLADNKVAEFSEWDFGLLDGELKDIFNLDMSGFGFLGDDIIDWAGVEDLSEETYEKPEKDRLECPQCHHVDDKTHFKKVQ